MKRNLVLFAMGLLAAGPAFSESHGASGDAGAGEKAFRQCTACHVVVNDAGETLAGRNARTGPNLYGIAGRAAGSVEDYRYSSGMQAAAEAGVIWTEENFVNYVQGPTAFLRQATGDSGARSKMTYRVRDEQEAKDLYAYLSSLSAE